MTPGPLTTIDWIVTPDANAGVSDRSYDSSTYEALLTVERVATVYVVPVTLDRVGVGDLVDQHVTELRVGEDAVDVLARLRGDRRPGWSRRRRGRSTPVSVQPAVSSSLIEYGTPGVSRPELFDVPSVSVKSAMLSKAPFHEASKPNACGEPSGVVCFQTVIVAFLVFVIEHVMTSPGSVGVPNAYAPPMPPPA